MAKELKTQKRRQY